MENFLPDKNLEANWTGQVLEHEAFAPGMTEAHRKKHFKIWLCEHNFCSKSSMFLASLRTRHEATPGIAWKGILSTWGTHPPFSLAADWDVFDASSCPKCFWNACLVLSKGICGDWLSTAQLKTDLQMVFLWDWIYVWISLKTCSSAQPFVGSMPQAIQVIFEMGEPTRVVALHAISLLHATFTPKSSWVCRVCNPPAPPSGQRLS